MGVVLKTEALEFLLRSIGGGWANNDMGVPGMLLGVESMGKGEPRGGGKEEEEFCQRARPEPTHIRKSPSPVNERAYTGKSWTSTASSSHWQRL
eukprot:CAMPEP_0184666960 /NCGR_PEP_ID=MMETSP0308-20130426/64802_1 /TAXON_ID=38269 /ORGANISM="Gloeochaete witrockiana, Strain SAG 46.84" /LENGTH=93 /DNA_ID=CAMNT_0027111881 /DNA_START=349 /DNA_END=630 /DNA_ORIENTATION=-